MMKFFKTLRKLFLRPAVACVAISALVFAVVLIVRANGLLQVAEVFVYDRLVKARTKLDCKDDRIVLIGMTEADLIEFGYPLSDRDFAKVLRGIEALKPELKPAVIGMDFYRNLPEPRNRDGYKELESALQELKSIVAITRYPLIKGPPALAQEPDRVAVNNLVKDDRLDGVCRRGLLMMEDVPKGEEKIPSLSLVVTCAYLRFLGVPYEEVELDGATVLRLGKTVIPRLKSDFGGYVDAPTFDYEYMVDFECPRRFRIHPDNNRARDQYGTNTPHDFTFGQVIRGEIPQGALAGKIVYIATVMQSIKDSNPTPIDDNLRGVEQHVMMTHQLLQAAFDGVPPMSSWREWAEVMWIAAAALLGGIVGLLLHSPWKIVPALSLLLAGFYFAGVFAFSQRIWILVAAPMLVCAVSAALVTSLVAYLESAERGMMKTIFSKHMSGPVVDALMGEKDQFLDGGRLKPQRVVATVLFTDLKGFSTTSEKMDPATLMDWMNDYFNGIASHVDECGGIINKFIGDAIMGVFGVPVARTTESEMDLDAKNAVECALAMRAALQRLNAGWLAEGRPTTAMRIGIHTGPLVSGSVGSEARLEFTVLGDTVNTAARLEGAGKDFSEDAEAAACTILISDATCKRLHGGYVTRLLGPLSLKGKADQVIVHSVISSTVEPTAQ